MQTRTLLVTTTWYHVAEDEEPGSWVPSIHVISATLYC